jgi:hypothetical protein
MSFKTTLEQRIRTLETTLTRLRASEKFTCRPGQPIENSTIALLQELTEEAKEITAQTKAEGDLRTALASILARLRIADLGARLRGEVDDGTQTNVLNVHLDTASALGIAEMYIARHGKGNRNEY